MWEGSKAGTGLDSRQGGVVKARTKIGEGEFRRLWITTRTNRKRASRKVRERLRERFNLVSLFLGGAYLVQEEEANLAILS